MELNHFMTILLLDPYFKINGWIYKGILGVLVKKNNNMPDVIRDGDVCKVILILS